MKHLTSFQRIESWSAMTCANYLTLGFYFGQSDFETWPCPRAFDPPKPTVSCLTMSSDYTECLFGVILKYVTKTCGGVLSHATSVQ